ncbi:MFS transporter [Deinococcus pimensis]|uniref:MFS transporter n=1 Tax=Deinococcus pimensis TaxID=309888 RepID=UPI000482355A|nr:MFS transporter [Deinococcus pimensis]
MSTAASRPARARTFEALRNPAFRALWIALLVSALGTWMQIVSLSLLVLRVTKDSALALGLVSLAQAAAFFLLSFVGGSFADRLDKRRLLLVTQVLLAACAAAFGVIAVTNHVSLPLILTVAFASSAVLSFDQPARSALVPMLVAPEQLTNAVALQSVAFSAASAVGPALAGFLVGVLGPGGIFFLNAASFLGMLVVLWRLKVPEGARGGERRPLGESLREALRAVRADRVLPWVILGYGTLLFCGPSVSLILPLFSRTTLHLNSTGLGWLFTATGIGTILGGLIVASLGEVRRKGLLFLGGIALWVAALVAFGFARSLLPAMLALFAFGLGLNAVQSTAITLMQSRVERAMRGRLMSVNTLLMMGLRPLGDFPAGALAGIIGPPGVVWLGAGIVGAVALLLASRRPLREV